MYIGEFKLVQAECIDYLGMKIDENISWNAQTDSLCKKLVFIVSRLSRLRKVIPSYMLAYIHISIIQPKIDYAITPWGYTCQLNLHKIQRLQSRAARIVSGNYDYVNTRGIELVKSLQWMNVHQRRYYFMSILMCRCIHGLAPDCLFNKITMQNEISERTTRSLSSFKVHVPYASIECFKKYFIYRGPVLWNALSVHIKECTTLGMFKTNLRCFMKK